MSLKMLVIFQRFQSDDIPIYGHNEQEDKRPNTANQRQNVFWIMNNFNNHYQVPKSINK